MKKYKKMEEYIYFRIDNITKEISYLSSKIKKLEYEKLECSRKMEEIQKNLDVGKNLFFVDKSDITFVKSETEQLENRILEIERESKILESDWQNKMKEKYILDDIVSDVEKLIDDEPILYDKFKISEEIYQKFAEKVKEDTIQETTRALQKSELCENVIDFDIMRAKLELEDINKFLKKSIRELRRFIYDVNPIDIVFGDLEKSIIKLIAFIENQSDIEITFGKKGTAVQVEQEIIWIVIRFMQCVIELDRKLIVKIILEYMEGGIQIQITCTQNNKNNDITVDKIPYFDTKDRDSLNNNRKIKNQSEFFGNLNIIQEKIESIHGTYEENIKEDEKNYIIYFPMEK